jgi:antitoxin ChpS
MNVVLRKYGNSTVVVLPPGVLRDLRIKAGHSMTLSTTDGAMTLVPKRRYSLDELLAQCDTKAAPPADMALWESARPVGQEAW